MITKEKKEALRFFLNIGRGSWSRSNLDQGGG